MPKNIKVRNEMVDEKGVTHICIGKQRFDSRCIEQDCGYRIKADCICSAHVFVPQKLQLLGDFDEVIVTINDTEHRFIKPKKE